MRAPLLPLMHLTPPQLPLAPPQLPLAPPQLPLAPPQKKGSNGTLYTTRAMSQLSLASTSDNNTKREKVFYANLCDRTYIYL